MNDLFKDWTADELLKLQSLCMKSRYHPELVINNQDNEIGTNIYCSNLFEMAMRELNKRFSYAKD